MEASSRIQLCGRLVVRLDGRRLESSLPGRKGRLLLAFLVLHRARPLPREHLLMACWGDDAPGDAGAALSVTLSKLRGVLGPGRIEGRSEVELHLPEGTFVDVESAIEAAHRAETCISDGQWAEAWGPAGIAAHIAERPLLAGCEAPWIDEWRRRLDDVRLRGLEAFARAALELGGPALRTAELASAEVIRLAPFRESAHRLLMEALARKGNTAEALRAYDALRLRLRDDLGIAPGPAVQELHRRLLRDSA